MTKPITPSEAAKKSLELIPPGVVEAFNTLIAQNYEDGVSTFSANAIIDQIRETVGCTREEVFTHRYLNIESLFVKAGWSVRYDTPGYNESYPATFTFRASK